MFVVDYEPECSAQPTTTIPSLPSPTYPAGQCLSTTVTFTRTVYEGAASLMIIPHFAPQTSSVGSFNGNAISSAVPVTEPVSTITTMSANTDGDMPIISPVTSPPLFNAPLASAGPSMSQTSISMPARPGISTNFISTIPVMSTTTDDDMSVIGPVTLPPLSSTPLPSVGPPIGQTSILMPARPSDAISVETIGGFESSTFTTSSAKNTVYSVSTQVPAFSMPFMDTPSAGPVPFSSTLSTIPLTTMPTMLPVDLISRTLIQTSILPVTSATQSLTPSLKAPAVLTTSPEPVISTTAPETATEGPPPPTQTIPLDETMLSTKASSISSIVSTTSLDQLATQAPSAEPIMIFSSTAAVSTESTFPSSVLISTVTTSLDQEPTQALSVEPTSIFSSTAVVSTESIFRSSVLGSTVTTGLDQQPTQAILVEPTSKFSSIAALSKELTSSSSILIPTVTPHLPMQNPPLPSTVNLMPVTPSTSNETPTSSSGSSTVSSSKTNASSNSSMLASLALTGAQVSPTTSDTFTTLTAAHTVSTSVPVSSICFSVCRTSY